jgi:hypothetical protein
VGLDAENILSIKLSMLYVYMYIESYHNLLFKHAEPQVRRGCTTAEVAAGFCTPLHLVARVAEMGRVGYEGPEGVGVLGRAVPGASGGR